MENMRPANLAKNSRSIRRFVLLLAVLVVVVSVPAALKAKSNFEKHLPPVVSLPDLITVQDKLYFREGCSVPANLDNCDGATNCYTQEYLIEHSFQPHVKLALIPYKFGSFLPVYSGPEFNRPSVYIPYQPDCVIRYESVAMG